MAFVCELSGEPLSSSTASEVAVTPSGHVCLKKLLLSKLAENGGMDPFLPNDVPLSSDQLITLSSSSPSIIPPRPSVTSMPSLLNLLDKEYSSLVLELFDTRKALEETRKELSHALYQNDAAVRVVARLAQERDQARQALVQWKNSGDGSSVVQEGKKQDEEDDEPPAKRAKTTTTTDTSSIPPEDLQKMTTTWQSLVQQRKELKKTLQPASPETLQTLTEVDKKNWHKTRNKAGIVDLRYSQNTILTAGRDKQVILYSLESKQLVETVNVGAVVTSMDGTPSILAAATPDGSLVYYLNGQAVGEPLDLSEHGTIVHVALHPTGQHVVATCENGAIILVRLLPESSLQVMTTFQTPSTTTTYSSADLHPDGLICAAGTSTGEVHLWDFKNQTLADTYESQEMKSSPIVAVAFSNSGYHLAIATASVVQVRDIRKNKVLFTLKREEEVSCLGWNVSGKYLAIGGSKGATVVTCKEGTTVVTVGESTSVSNVVWSSETELVTSGSADRQVRFYGISNKDEEMEE